ncbi:MAG: PilN domain-containing protein [Candidatus Riflebacteria bacterium]|nr:PilN domain-containing protein [Candidatus Riflebacteria bacterium]
MIKINLITIKRRKPIQIPFAAIFLVIAIAAILVGFFFATQYMDTYNDDKKEQLKNLEAEVKQSLGKFTARDSLRQQLSTLESQIEQLKQLSGVDLLQWSEVFSTLTRVVPDKTVWITNLRIDTDRRVQITGYACAENQEKAEAKGAPRLTVGIQNFIKQLQENSYFAEVFLSNANKNTYEKAPVWRFDITCRIKRDIGSK